jgi:hypothetical protein
MSEQNLTTLDFPLSWLELDRPCLLHNLAGIRALVGTIMALSKNAAAGAVGRRALSQAGVRLWRRRGGGRRASGQRRRAILLTLSPARVVIFSVRSSPTVFTLDAAINRRALRSSVRFGSRWIGLGRIGVPFQSADFVCTSPNSPAWKSRVCSAR